MIIVRPLPISGILFLLLCVAILCTLGIWQVKRLEWKTGLIKTMEEAYTRDPRKNPLNTERINKVAQEAQPFEYGAITGTISESHDFLIGPRTQDGVPGYHRLVPFTLSDGGTILVNRGWISVEAVLTTGYTEQIGTMTLTGVLRRPDKPNPFTPRNSSTAWYSVDPHAMAQVAGMPDFPPVVFYASNGQRPQIELPNNHLQYAIFWFTMAFLFAALPLAYTFWPLPKE